MRTSLPLRGWFLTVRATPVLFDDLVSEWYRLVPDGGLLASAWNDGRSGDAGRQSDAAWHPSWGGWRMLGAFTAGRRAQTPFALVPSGIQLSREGVAAALAEAVRLSAGGRLSRAILAALPEDPASLHLALSVMSS